MLTVKQERFAQLVGVTPDEPAWACYMEAYDANGKIKTATEAASRLLADSNISARVEEVRLEARHGAALTLKTHLKRLDDIGHEALKGEETKSGNVVKNFGAAVAAEVARGKHSGVAAPDKHQDVTPDVPPEEAITDLCTQNGVLNNKAHKAGMEMIRLLREPAYLEVA